MDIAALKVAIGEKCDRMGLAVRDWEDLGDQQHSASNYIRITYEKRRQSAKGR